MHNHIQMATMFNGVFGRAKTKALLGETHPYPFIDVTLILLFRREKVTHGKRGNIQRYDEQWACNRKL